MLRDTRIPWCWLAAVLLSGCGQPSEPAPALEMASAAERWPDEAMALVESDRAGARLDELRARFRPHLAPAARTPLGGAPARRTLPRTILRPGPATQLLALENGRVRPVFVGGSRAGASSSVHVELPPLSSGFVDVIDAHSGVSVAFALLGARRAPIATADGIAWYEAGSAAGGDTLLRPYDGGVEDFVVFEQRPEQARVTYQVALTQVAGLRLHSNVLEFLDEEGAPRLHLARPYLIDAAGRTHDARIALLDCAYDDAPQSSRGRPVTPPGGPHCRVELSWSEAALRYPALLDPAWESAELMSVQRRYHALITLPGDRALTAGGSGMGGSPETTAEIYDPTPNPVWTPTDGMDNAYVTPALVFLPAPIGRALIVGSGNAYELYDPILELWLSTGKTMLGSHFAPTATLLQDGTVLVAGGAPNPPYSELYDPATDTWALTQAADMSGPRYNHTASLLPDGRVLVTGGSLSGVITNTVEIYDPVAGSWSAGPPLTTARGWHTATVLPSGDVMIVGGGECQDFCETLPSVEMFDPTTDSWSAGPTPNQSRMEHVAEVLPSGWVLFAGGHFCDNLGCVMPPTVELYGPAGTWTLIEQMIDHRANHASTLVADAVLVSGGDGCSGHMCTINASAETYRPAALGTTCALAGECLSGFCEDGVCCDAACDAACHACTAALKAGGADGECGPAPAGDDPRGLCSDQGPSSCGQTGACAAGGQCELYAAGTECAPPECTPELYTTSACDGQGVCEPESVGCAPYAFDCDELTCLDSCSSDEDCVAESRCDTDSGNCVSGATCDGEHTVTTATGNTVDCSPYLCTPDGACRDSCDTDEDCVDTLVCDRNRHCVPAPASTVRSEDEGSCGCRLVGRVPRRHGALALLAWAAGAWIVRRKSRRARPACQR